MPEKVKLYFNGSTFQNFDGTNFTTVGVEAKTGFALGAYAGLGADFSDKSTGVIDVKYCGKYAKNCVIGYNGRVRTKLGENEKSIEVRVSPLAINVPFNERFAAYFTPCCRAKYDVINGEWKPSGTIFTGLTYKPNEKMAVYFEVQNYNSQNLFNKSGKFWDGDNWSGNVILSIKL